MVNSLLYNPGNRFQSELHNDNLVVQNIMLKMSKKPYLASFQKPHYNSGKLKLRI